MSWIEFYLANWFRRQLFEFLTNHVRSFIIYSSDITECENKDADALSAKARKSFGHFSEYSF